MYPFLENYRLNAVRGDKSRSFYEFIPVFLYLSQDNEFVCSKFIFNFSLHVR